MKLLTSITFSPISNLRQFLYKDSNFEIGKINLLVIPSTFISFRFEMFIDRVLRNDMEKNK